ncbi:unnamed protein product [Polarella glacialis]|uniref:Uncharacterized protein n=1 Tax=Polarella glacialis TaxID=89957 RepID=A0A813I0G5_POLGL|nr:unnamed protein product [Polarella glacialis]
MFARITHDFLSNVQGFCLALNPSRFDGSELPKFLSICDAMDDVARANARNCWCIYLEDVKHVLADELDLDYIYSVFWLLDIVSKFKSEVLAHSLHCPMALVVSNPSAPHELCQVFPRFAEQKASNSLSEGRSTLTFMYQTVSGELVLQQGLESDDLFKTHKVCRVPFLQLHLYSTNKVTDRVYQSEFLEVKVVYSTEEDYPCSESDFFSNNRRHKHSRRDGGKAAQIHSSQKVCPMMVFLLDLKGNFTDVARTILKKTSFH